MKHVFSLEQSSSLPFANFFANSQTCPKVKKIINYHKLFNDTTASNFCSVTFVTARTTLQFKSLEEKWTGFLIYVAYLAGRYFYLKQWTPVSFLKNHLVSRRKNDKIWFAASLDSPSVQNINKPRREFVVFNRVAWAAPLFITLFDSRYSLKWFLLWWNGWKKMESHDGNAENRKAN